MATTRHEDGAPFHPLAPTGGRPTVGAAEMAVRVVGHNADRPMGACDGNRGTEVSGRLVPMLREIVTYEVRRLLGRRPPSARSSPARVSGRPPPVPIEEPPPLGGSPAEDPWASNVLDHVERVMNGQVRTGRLEPVPAPSTAGSSFEALDLGLVPDAVGHIVRSRPGIAEKELVPLVAEELMLGELPANHRRLLGRLVWSARGRRLIELTDGAWTPGPVRDGVIPELDGWSLDTLARLAGEMKDLDTSEEAVFQAVLAELVGTDERAPRIVAICTGAAIALARRRGDLDFDRWGQASLDLDGDG